MVTDLFSTLRFTWMPWNGGIGKVQEQWLTQQLSKAEKQGKKVIILCHFQLFARSATAFEIIHKPASSTNGSSEMHARQLSDALEAARKVAPGASFFLNVTRLQAAVERERARLLTRGGLNPELGGALPSVAGGSLDAAPGASPAQLGRSIGQAIYRGIGR